MTRMDGNLQVFNGIGMETEGEERGRRERVGDITNASEWFLNRHCTYRTRTKETGKLSRAEFQCCP